MLRILTALVRALLSAVTSRLPIDSPSRRELVDAVLWQLPDVCYGRLRDQGFRPGGIIDVGAHIGDWTRAILEIFPSTPVLMIEARDEPRGELDRIKTKFPHVNYEIALLGSEEKKSVPFFVHSTGSSMFGERSNVPRTVTSASTSTLDGILSSHPNLIAPLFLKIDVQGGELEVLRGATKALSLVEMVQVEASLLHYNEGAPTAAEIVDFMDARGFALYDIAGFVRPEGKDLVQLDFVFAKKDSPLRKDYFHYPL